MRKKNTYSTKNAGYQPVSQILPFYRFVNCLILIFVSCNIPNIILLMWDILLCFWKSMLFHENTERSCEAKKENVTPLQLILSSHFLSSLLPAQEVSAYVSLAVMNWIHCSSSICFYVCVCACMLSLKMQAPLLRVCPSAVGLIGVCFPISAQQLFQKLKNLMRPYSVEFESPLELSAQGRSEQSHANTLKHADQKDTYTCIWTDPSKLPYVQH